MAVCKIEGCNAERIYCRGLCSMHYTRWRMGKSMHTPKYWRPSNRGECTVSGCDKNAHARGYCLLHYQRWRFGLDVNAPYGMRKHTTCTVDGCDRPHLARGYCSMHYYRARTQQARKQREAESEV